MADGGWTGEQLREVVYCAAQQHNGITNDSEGQNLMSEMGKVMFPQYRWDRLRGGSTGPQLTWLEERGLLCNRGGVHTLQNALSPEGLKKLLYNDEQHNADDFKNSNLTLFLKFEDFMSRASAEPKADKTGMPTTDNTLSASVKKRYRENSHIIPQWLLKALGFKDPGTFALMILEAMEVNRARIDRDLITELRSGHYVYVLLCESKEVPPTVAALHGKELNLTPLQREAFSLVEELEAYWKHYVNSL
jgi:hypothetical protein